MLFVRPKRAISSVWIHCSASDRPEHDDVSVITDWHVRGNGWAACGYHFYIRKSGEVQKGRDLEMTPAAQAPRNSGSIAICLGGLEVQNFTEAQFVSLVDLAQQIDRAYEGRITFHGHTEIKEAWKPCPVFDYTQVLGLDDLGHLAFPSDTSVQRLRAAAPPAPTTSLRLFDRGQRVASLQEALNRQGERLVVDGVFGKATLLALRDYQRRMELGVDGIAGPITQRALGVI